MKKQKSFERKYITIKKVAKCQYVGTYTYNCMMLSEEIRYDFPLSDSEYTHRVYWNDIMHRIWNWLKVIKRQLGWS